MEKSEVLEIRQALLECDAAIDISVKAVYEKIKEGCNTFGEVEEKIYIIRKNLSWASSDREACIRLIERISKVMEKEISGLPLTNRL